MSISSKASPRAAAKDRPAKAAGKQALLLAATELMRERGGIDITLSEVAARSGLNSALVKYYFGNKEGLLLGVLQEAVETPLISILELLEDKSINPEQKLRILIRDQVKMFRLHPYMNRLFVELTSDRVSSMTKAIASRMIRNKTDAYRRILEEGEASGIFREVDPMLFYFSVIGAAHHIFSSEFVLKHIFGSPGMTDELAARVAEHTSKIILSGIKSH